MSLLLFLGLQFWLPAVCYQQAGTGGAGGFFSRTVAVASFQANLHTILYSHSFVAWMDKTFQPSLWKVTVASAEAVKMHGNKL